jgi:asparagine synthase (glutamine-hydrolysing)
MYIDINFWLPNDILLKADKMSMANSVELRVPLLDVEVWKLSKKLPTKYMVRNGETKEIFRSIAKEKLPEEWSKRRKLGFPVPFGKWVKEEKYYNLIKQTFNSEYAKEFFDIDYINNLLEEHYNGNAANGKKIYVIYIFLIWYKRFFIDEVNNSF